MQFEDIAHKYDIVKDPEEPNPITLYRARSDGNFVYIGEFRDETIARNVALALEFYKVHNVTRDTENHYE